MNNSTFVIRFAAVLAVIVSCALFGLGQNRERFGISAKAGGVNAVSGQVMVKRAGQNEQLLTSQDDLQSGDIVSTGYGSQAEILLNPGSYLRLAEKSEFVMADNSLDDLLVKLNKGSAIIEATGASGVELRIPIVTEQQRITIVRAGIYRINASPGLTEVLVRGGRIFLGDDPRNVIKSGKRITITSGTAALPIAKLTKNDKDSFDNWSKQRAETLARANQKLSTRALNGFLSTASWRFPDASFGRWGLWTWSPFASCYTFLPFYFGWGSPYGGFYGMYAGFGGFYGDGSCCRRRVYSQPSIIRDYTPRPTGTYPSDTGGATPSGKGSMDSAPRPDPPPAVIRPNPEFGGRGANKIRDPQ